MPLLPTEDLIDAVEVARLLGLSHRNTVSQYLVKYQAMPRPIIDLGPSRPRLWLRREVESWIARRGPVRRDRPRNDSSRSSENRHPPGGWRLPGGDTSPNRAPSKEARIVVRPGSARRSRICNRGPPPGPPGQPPLKRGGSLNAAAGLAPPKRYLRPQPGDVTRLKRTAVTVLNRSA